MQVLEYLYVKGGLIGDKVVAKIDLVKKNFALASLVDIIEASKDRIKLDFEVKEARGWIP